MMTIGAWIMAVVGGFIALYIAVVAVTLVYRMLRYGNTADRTVATGLLLVLLLVTGVILHTWGI